MLACDCKYNAASVLMDLRLVAGQPASTSDHAPQSRERVRIIGPRRP